MQNCLNKNLLLINYFQQPWSLKDRCIKPTFFFLWNFGSSFLKTVNIMKQTLSISHSSKTLLFIHGQSVPHFPLSFLYSQQVSKWAFKILFSHQSQPSLDCLCPFSLFKSNSFLFPPYKGFTGTCGPCGLLLP